MSLLYVYKKISYQLNSSIRQLLNSNFKLLRIFNSKFVCINNLVVGILPLYRLFETHSLWLVNHVKVSFYVVILLNFCLESKQIRSTNFILWCVCHCNIVLLWLEYLICRAGIDIVLNLWYWSQFLLIVYSTVDIIELLWLVG